MQQPFLPSYGSCILFELYKSDETPYIQIFYKKTPKTKVKPMKIPNCGVKCLLDDLYKLYDDFLPTLDYNVECQLRDGESLPAEGNPEKIKVSI